MRSIRTVSIFLLSIFTWSIAIGQFQSIKSSGSFSKSPTDIHAPSIIIDLPIVDSFTYRSINFSFSNLVYDSIIYSIYTLDTPQINGALNPDHDSNDDKSFDESITCMMILPANATGMQLLLYPKDTNAFINYKYEIFYQNLYVIAPSLHNTDQAVRNDCQCEMPSFKNRIEWACPWGEDSTIFIPEYSSLTHFVIHHQGGTAIKPYDATVRAIWNYHVNNNGWSDIGYHWLIAPDGTIYKGRAWLDGDQNVLGAHICSCNSNKMGICLLGDLTDSTTTINQYNSLVKLLAYKACELGIDPDLFTTCTSKASGQCVEEELHNIIGHRDGCVPGYTECPGNSFYPDLPKVISDVQMLYEQCIGNLANQNNLNFDEDFSISPNPGQGHYTLNLPKDIKSNFKLHVFDIMGQSYGIIQYILQDSKCSFECQLPKGAYMLRIESNDFKRLLLFFNL